MRRKRYILILMVTIISLCFSQMSVSAASKYGKYKGKTYYYTVSKTKKMRIEKKGKSVGSHLNDWMQGNVKLVVSFALDSAGVGYITIPFDVVEGLVKNDDVKYYKKSYSSYVFQTQYTTREIYYYADRKKKVKKVALIDEKGVADVFYEFHPVGVGFKKSTYSKKIKSKAKVQTKYYGNKTRNLKRCLVNQSHKSKEVWRVSSELLTEKWTKK